MYRSVHRRKIGTVFVADKFGALSCETRALGSIDDNNQPTAETLDRGGMFHDLSEILFFCDSANEPECDSLRTFNARGHRVGRRKPPNIDKR